MTLVHNVELALSQGVPELDGPVTGTGDDLTVVGGERDAVPRKRDNQTFGIGIRPWWARGDMVELTREHRWCGRRIAWWWYQC